MQQTVAVLNDDPHHFEFATISSPQLAGSNVAVRIAAMEADGRMVSFNGSASLAAVSPAGPLPVSPAFAGADANISVWVTNRGPAPPPWASF